MRMIAVDDEMDTLEEIRSLVENVPGLTLEKVYVNPLKALSEIGAVKPDGVFLDIEMPGMNGIDLAERILAICPETCIVFLTAFNHYATEAFEVNALDYVLKPIHPDRFAGAVAKIMRNGGPERHDGKVAIQSLGAMEVLADGQPVRWNRAKSKELFAYLLHHAGAKQNKFKICEALWPEMESKKALVNLQTAVCAMRKSLMSLRESELRITYAEDCYTLHIKKAVWDARVFEDLYKRAQIHPDIEIIQEAVALYQGEYFSGEDYKWAVLASESLAGKYERLLEMLAGSYFEQSRSQDAAQTLLRLLRRRPLSGRQQVLILKAAHEEGGVTGMLKQAKMLRELCRTEYDADLEQEAAAFLESQGKTK